MMQKGFRLVIDKEAFLVVNEEAEDGGKLRFIFEFNSQFFRLKYFGLEKKRELKFDRRSHDIYRNSEKVVENRTAVANVFLEEVVRVFALLQAQRAVIYRGNERDRFKTARGEGSL
ncbi:MAG: hypothetical protein ACI9BD_000383 [Candidatus Marinamargulisbacteria bacterium]|jgi:hypothetical protein